MAGEANYKAKTAQKHATQMEDMRTKNLNEWVVKKGQKQVTKIEKKLLRDQVCCGDAAPLISNSNNNINYTPLPLNNSSRLTRKPPPQNKINCSTCRSSTRNSLHKGKTKIKEARSSSNRPKKRRSQRAAAAKKRSRTRLCRKKTTK